MNPLDKFKECVNTCDSFCVSHKAMWGVMSSTSIKDPKKHIKIEDDDFLNVTYGGRPKTYLDFHIYRCDIAIHEFNAKDVQVYRFNFMNKDSEAVEFNFEKKLEKK